MISCFYSRIGRHISDIRLFSVFSSIPEPFQWPEGEERDQWMTSSLKSQTAFSPKGEPLQFAAVNEAYKRVLSDTSLCSDSKSFSEQILSLLVGSKNKEYLDKTAIQCTPSSFATYKLTADFLRFTTLCPQVFLPFVGNSIEHVIRRCGLRGGEYRMMNYRSGDWNIGGTMEDLLLAGKGSCFLVPFNGSYPNSVSLSPNEWKQICGVCYDRNHLLWLDINNFGLCNSISYDQECIQTILESGVSCVMSVGLRRSFGLYMQDLGCVVTIGDNRDTIEMVLRRCASELWYSEPYLMKRVVNEVLNDSTLLLEWEKECSQFRNGIESIRSTLIEASAKRGCPSYAYEYLQNQKGPFSRITVYRGVNETLKKHLGRYGVLNISSINDKNLASVIKMMKD